MVATNSEDLPSKVIVHPLVLLSVVDHFNRIAKGVSGDNLRVVGVLLGHATKGYVEVSNSYAVPFEEDPKDPNSWFLDHDYAETMRAMFKKINAKEKVVGWYHSGPKLRESDLQINDIFKRYIPDPVLVVVDVQPEDVGIPTKAYFAIEEISDDGSAAKKAFKHVSSEIGAEEAEEIGVDHLLRDVKDETAGSLSTRVTYQLNSLRGLKSRLANIQLHLQKKLDENKPVNPQIVSNLQQIFNLLPTLTIKDNASTFSSKANDEYLIIYISAVIRSVIALHDLIDNKIENRQREVERDRPSDSDAKLTDEAKAAKAGSEAGGKDSSSGSKKDATKS
ncbi:proteasome regulatory particle subunit [Spiromyces aspiralis]|uniref:Proteasome regulatory particle subunit n=1 Tax=Spiromyces aspiralis TaxID=68401 RepID=A0ACC1HWX1_9FUNG|nr:proteasome regulatory particle subunit [Spiromyces aspiralis]